MSFSPDKIEMENKILLEVTDIKKSYPGLPTLEDISLKLGQNQFVSVLRGSYCHR